MSRLQRVLKRALVAGFRLVYGSKIKRHRVPLGPIAGRFLYMAPATSLRMFIGIDEPAIARLTRAVLKEDDVVYDIGAHVGYTMVLFADLVGRGGRVHAFELLPSTAELLRKARDANGLSQCAVHAVGASDSNEPIVVHASDTLMGSIARDDAANVGGISEVCQLVRLDDYRHRYAIAAPALIKIDVEGAEVKALRGAEDTLRTAVPLLIVEFHNIDVLREGFAWLTERGYLLQDMSGARLQQARVAAMSSYYGSLFCYDPTVAWHVDRVRAACL
jgi:FkbM family methyltransferase